MLELTASQYRKDLAEAAETGAKIALMAIGALSPTISKNQAYKIYGEGTVDRWIREGLIKVEKDGPKNSKTRIDRLKIDLVSKSSNRVSWYNNHNVPDK